MKLTKTILFSLIILSLFVFFPCPSHALVTLGGNGPLGSFTGTLEYTFQSAEAAALEITLKNVSPIDNGGYITGFVFNNPGNKIKDVSLLSTDDDFELLGEIFDNEIGADPFGQFDIGAALNENFLGGGKPQKGIAVGDEETFTFSLIGAQLNALTEQAFLNTFSEPPGIGEGAQNLVLRFRGFNDGGSNKTPNTITNPEPASFLLLGFGLAGAFFRRKFV